MIRGPSAVECGIVEWALGRGRLPLAVAGSDPPGWLDQQADPQLGEAVLARAAAAYQAALGSRLIAGYALGSLAHGGFCPLVSDVDLGLILRDPPRAGDRMTIRKVARSVRAGGSALDQRLSVFWATPAEFALGYLGGDAQLTNRIRGWVRLRPHDDDALAEIRTPSRLVSRGPRRLTKIVLFPVRFLFTAETGQVATNAIAARHYLASPDPPAAALVAAALAWRLEPPVGNEAIALLSRELVPLYVQYVDDHIARLRAVDRRRLADSFQRWRTLLLA